MGAVHALRIKSPYKLLHVEDIEIKYVPNEHGKLYLKCLLDDSINFKYSIEASTKDEITVYEEKEDENNNLEVDINNVDISKSVVIFNGIVENIKTTNKDGLYYIEIEGISKSSELDIQEKSRSFQNVNMTYDELIGTILKDYSGYGFTQCIGEGQAIEKPIFQYKETDWNFLKRISSELKSEIYCDIIDLNNTLYFGTNSGKNYELQDDISYKACKDLKTFYKAGGYDLGFHDTDYFYYEIKSREKCSIGDNIYFKQKDVYVSDYEAYKYQDEIIYKYKLRRKNGVWQTKIYNSLLCGASLEGKVLAVEGGEMEGIKPTVGEYNSALKDSMVNSGFSVSDADLITEIAANQQRVYGLTEVDEVPRIPGRINAIER
ncbi:phage late control D family protein [Clostridium sp. ZBS20]|uniref:phage late control D family protein n=1 Tax=Clostridium sp. ZBS20 TaxID=2949966 RepID=UPI00207A294C|nr:phage late control D family protein [Clostridium sp. ZBS20]